MSARSARPPASNWVIESLRCLIIFSTMATVWASLTSMRSSTSLRLISAISRRIVLSLPVSLARIAAFMSSVTCSLRPMAVSPSISCDIKTKTRCGEPERACDSYGYYYPQETKHTRVGLCAVLPGWFCLVSLRIIFSAVAGCGCACSGALRQLPACACAQFGQQTGFFDSAFEATHCDFERLVFFKANSGHVKIQTVDL